MLTNPIPTLAISDRQDLYSMAYVRAMIAAAGFNFSKSELDRNSDDLHVEHIQIDGFIPAYDRLLVQVKCTYAHSINSDNTIHFPLPVKNYNQLRMEKIVPKILVVVLVPNPTSEPWIECVSQHTIFRYRAYWMSLMGLGPTSNKDNITVNVPIANSFDIDAVRFLRFFRDCAREKWPLRGS